MRENKVPKRQYTQEYKLESARLAQSVGINEAARRLGLPSASYRDALDAGSKNDGASNLKESISFH